MARSLAVAASAVAAAHGAANNFFVAPLEHAFQLRDEQLSKPLSDMTVNTVNVDGEGALVIGGCNTDKAVLWTDCANVSSEAFIFYPSTGEFANLPSLPRARTRHSTAILDNKAYVFGGFGDDNAGVLPIDVLDLETLTWEADVASLSSGITDGVAFTHNGKVFYTAGYFSADFSGNTLTVSMDASYALTNETELSIPEVRGDARVAHLDGKVYVIGGFDAGFDDIADMEVFDGTWATEKLASLSFGRGDKAVAVLHDKIYVFGGEENEGDNINERKLSARVEVYDPATNSWFHGGEMVDERFRFDAATVGDSIILVGGQQHAGETTEGGEALFKALNTIEEFIERSDIYSMPTVTVHGSGTTNPEFFFHEVMDLFTTGLRIPAHMSYRAVGSGIGQDEMVGSRATAFLPATQFSSGDLPLSKDNFKAISDRGHEVAHIPLALGGIGVYVNIPEARAGDHQVVLTACDLASIFDGTYTKWSELAHEGRNKFLENVDKSIFTVHRKYGSSSTFGFTHFLKAGCPSQWSKAGGDIDWPCDSSSANCNSESSEGSGQVKAYITNNEYSIGYLSAGHSFPTELSEVAIINKAGFPVVPSSDGILAASRSIVWPEDPFQSFEDVSPINVDGDDTYPIVLVTYVYVRKDLTGLGTAAQLVKTFLTYCINEGQGLLKKYAFVKVSETARALGMKAIENLEMPAGSMPFHLEIDAEAIVGADPFTVSMKRGSFATSSQEMMNKRVTDLETSVASIDHDGDDHDHDHDDDGHDDETSVVAIVGLVIALVDLVLLGVVLVFLRGIRRSVKEARYLSQMTRGPAVSEDHSQNSNASASAAVRTMQQT